MDFYWNICGSNYVLVSERHDNASLKRITLTIFGWFTLLLSFSEAQAQTCISTGNGNWSNTGTWLCDGVNRLPTCWDTVLVQLGDEVSVTNQNDYTACGSSMVVDMPRDLRFTTGNKIDLPCGSLLSVQSTGRVYKGTSGGGSSTLISICSSVIWRAADGELNGPVSFGGFVLPVELLHFDVELLEDGYVASWITATDTENDYFSLEASSDGKE